MYSIVLFLATLETSASERADGRHTVPQIFINDQGIGSSDELAALNSSGKLDGLLAAAG